MSVKASRTFKLEKYRHVHGDIQPLSCDVICDVLQCLSDVLYRVTVDVSPKTPSYMADVCGDGRCDIRVDIPSNNFGDARPVVADVIAKTSSTTCACPAGCPSTRHVCDVTDDFSDIMYVI